MRGPPIQVWPLFLICICFGIYASVELIHLGDSSMGAPPEKSLPKLTLYERVTDFATGDRDFRLIFIGDVHGQYDDLQSLINEEIGGLDEETTIFLLGDMVNKGPDSDKVVSFILNNKSNVRCIMGNHDLAVLFAYMNPKLNRIPLRKIRKSLRPLEVDVSEESFFPDDVTKVKESHTIIAEELGFETLKDFSSHCPVSMEIELPDGTSLFNVHAGMLPGDFIETMPTVGSVTEMKFVDPEDWSDYSKEEDEYHDTRWYKFWKGSALHKKFKHITVLYGHDANKGLNLHQHTKGMDSGCVKGGKLSGFMYSYNHKNHKLTHKLLQTDCEGYDF